MKKRAFRMLCMAILCVMAFTAPALAAEQATNYPISVEEYTEGDTPRIRKVYQLSLNEDPASIPTGDFERYGYVYHLLDITQHNDEGVDVKDYTDTITQDSDTGELAVVLKQLDGQREITTEDGYTGLLVLDHTSIEITVKGYNTSTRNLSANRTYPNLSDADLSLIPKTVDENGKTLTLNDVQWASAYPEITLQIAELLRKPESRAAIMSELRQFTDAYALNGDLLRFHRIHDPETLWARLSALDKPIAEFHAVDAFEPVRASFITEDEIDELLKRSGATSPSV